MSWVWVELLELKLFNQTTVHNFQLIMSALHGFFPLRLHVFFSLPFFPSFHWEPRRIHRQSLSFLYRPHAPLLNIYPLHHLHHYDKHSYILYIISEVTRSYSSVPHSYCLLLLTLTSHFPCLRSIWSISRTNRSCIWHFSVVLNCLQNYLSNFGMIKYLITDNYSGFHSKEFTKFTKFME